MRIRALVEVEDCFEDSSIREALLDAPLNEAAVMRLSVLGRLEYFREFPRPFFRVSSSEGFYLKGVVGEESFRVFFSAPPGPDGVARAAAGIKRALAA